MRLLNSHTVLILIVPLFALMSCSVQREVHTTENGVQLDQMLVINGIEQAVVIRGDDRNNPVLVHVHGGPGYPLFPYIDNFRELEKHFTIVYWEQRGTGKSLHSKVKPNGMVTDTLLSDLHQVVEYSKRLLNVAKVFMWGHSWGTNLGVLYANNRPENLLAYVGTGQSVNLLENERLCLKFAYSSAVGDENTKAIKQLSKIDTLDYQLSDALAIRKWVYTYGGIVHKVKTEKAYINFDIVKDVFATPEYNGATKWRIMFRSKYSGKNLWEDMMAIDLFSQVKSLHVPVYFFLGRYDHIVSSQLAERYFNVLDAKKGKQLIWFEESAHRPQTEEPQKFIKELLKVKKSLME